MPEHQPQYAHNHVINPETGFLENPAYPTHFDSSRKEAFLKNYRANGLRLRRACRQMGLSEATVTKHLYSDPLFKEKFEAVEKDYLEELQAISRTNALNPRSVIERIFLLKCLIPEKYGQENRPVQTNISIHVDNELISRAKNRDVILDAEEVKPVLLK